MLAEIRVDKVRASRDGHQYHEAWLARSSLGLLLPRDDLCAISVEGLSEDLEKGVAAAASEIADAVFYFGLGANFEEARSISITQFKYSIANARAEIHSADIRKTINKFIISEKSYISKYGESPTWGKIRYSVITNRPVSSDLLKAIEAYGQGLTPEAPSVRRQMNLLASKLDLPPHHLRSFFSRLDVVGARGPLHEVERGNVTIMIDWSASSDILAQARLGELRKLIRDKAGSAGQGNNLVRRVDVLAALGLAEERDLLPTPEAFPDIGPLIKRAQLDAFIEKLPSSSRWLIHAEGGIGKTVFSQSLYRNLSPSDEVVLFDCFGGGSYRSLVDGRHRPERGLMHVINELACRGLCDPILPSSSDPSEVIRRSILRFEQAISTIRRARPSGRLLIIMDAADNAAIEAKNRGQLSFPKELMESFNHIPIPDGLVLLATARTERCELAVGKANCSEFRLEPFSFGETEIFVGARRPDATTAQIISLLRRSNGNPRVLANLIEPERSLAGEAEIDDRVELDDLIKQRIDRATDLADAKGNQTDLIDAFLCALSVLPPPVPIAEMASAFDLKIPEIDSLSADLSPLLDRTRYGLIFRDEPTETLVRTLYGGRINLLDDVIKRLTLAQDKSVYAAKALPGLLFTLDQVDSLRELAFDMRFPEELAGDTAKRVIRLNRLRTALGASAKANNVNACVDLSVELSSIAFADERGLEYLLQNPELVVILGDTESLRRLFELRTSWPGTRHARLTVAYATDGDMGEAYRHMVRTQEWLSWAREQYDDSAMAKAVRTEIGDHAAIPYFLICNCNYEKARKYLTAYKPQFAYKIASEVLALCYAAEVLGKVPLKTEKMRELYDHDDACCGLITAVIADSTTMEPEVLKRLIIRLTTSLEGVSNQTDQIATFRDNGSFERAILRCAARAAHLGLAQEGTELYAVLRVRRYNIYALDDQFGASFVVPWLLTRVVESIAQAKTITLRDCLPIELEELIRDVELPVDDDGQEKILREKISELVPVKSGEFPSTKSQLSYSDKQRAPDYMGTLIRPLVQVVRCASSLLKATQNVEIESLIDELFQSWSKINSGFENSSYVRMGRRRFLDQSFSLIIFEVLAALGYINKRTGPLWSEALNRCESVDIRMRLELVRQLARLEDAHLEAGRAAVEAVRQIEREGNVTHRSELFATLSRALMPAALGEAASLFRRGLAELDALGSGDFEFMNEILVFSASIRGGPLRQELALRLAKICEINNYDPGKFPWPLAGKAFAKIWGLSYLAQIARWNDRDQVDLSYTLPSALAFMIRDTHIAAVDALPLLGLVDVVEWWDWHWHDLFQCMAEIGASTEDFELALDRYEANYMSEVFYRLDDIRNVIKMLPKVFEKLEARLNLMEDRKKRIHKVDRSTKLEGATEWENLSDTAINSDEFEPIRATLSQVDPTQASSIEEIFAKVEALEGTFKPTEVVFAELTEKVEYRDRGRFLDVIVAARNLPLYQKNQFLFDLKILWASDSPSGLQMLRPLGITLIKQHAQELLSGNWGFNWELNKVAEFSGASRVELAMALVEAATLRDLHVSATTWINLASILSAEADTDTPAKALERLLNSGAARLADKVGDGPWCRALDPGDQPADVAGGLVWYCLGSPDAAQRWRAAHVVRDLARLGRWKVISHLFQLLRYSEDAGAFQGRSLPFFILYARLWCLLAIGRVAKDFPDQMVPFLPVLGEIALDDAFPHVAIREAARRAIIACVPLAPTEELLFLRKQMLTINSSKIQASKRGKRVAVGTDWDRPPDIQQPDPPFHFEYDFGKYDLTNLATLFGFRRWEIDDRCISWIRKWDGTVTSMYDFAGRRNPSNGMNFRTGTSDGHHSFGTYLAWNAVAVVGGELLLTHPIVESSSYSDPWLEWLSKYSITRADGLWLADGTENYPLPALHDLMADTEKAEQPTSDKALLLSLVGIQVDLSIKENLAVLGHWTSPDRVDVSITSALVPSQYAELAARSLVTSPEFHMWLPYNQYESDDDAFDRDRYKPVEIWTSTKSAYAKLDGCDPIASIASMQRLRPALYIQRRFRLTSSEPWFSNWERPDHLSAFEAEAWGVRSGAGESERWERGNLLKIDREFLTHLLNKLQRNLLLLIKLQRYHEKNRYEDDSSGKGDFTHSWLVLTLDEHLEVNMHDLSEEDFRLVMGLPEQSRYKFRSRWNALMLSKH